MILTPQPLTALKVCRALLVQPHHDIDPRPLNNATSQYEQ